MDSEEIVSLPHALKIEIMADSEIIFINAQYIEKLSISLCAYEKRQSNIAAFLRKIKWSDIRLKGKEKAKFRIESAKWLKWWCDGIAKHEEGGVISEGKRKSDR